MCRWAKYSRSKATYLRHLLAHAANVVVADVVEFLLIFAADWLTLAVDLGVRGYNAVLVWVCFHNLELHAAHATAHQECVALRYWSNDMRLDQMRKITV